MKYLDNASTTKVLSEVTSEMLPYLSEIYGNPNSLYYEQAVEAKQAIEHARKRVSDLFKSEQHNVIFTSGSAESNNMILKGIASKNNNCHIITSKVEHSSILETCRYLETKGIEVTYLDVDETGKVRSGDLLKSIKPSTKLVSIMWVNNEIGTINNIDELADICISRDILFHTDATQAIGKIEFNLNTISKIDFLSMSSHKIYGPKGVGCLLIKKTHIQNDIIEPLIHGGNQEFHMRGGTLATHQIVGFGKAAEICMLDTSKNISKLKETEELLLNKITKQYGGKIEIINNSFEKVPGIVSVRFIGINNQILLKMISSDISASSGAACSNDELSHVLRAIGLKDNIIKETIRLSLSAYDDYLDFDEFE